MREIGGENDSLAVRFQLRLFGPFMPKSTHSKRFKHEGLIILPTCFTYSYTLPDVKFIPDGWQYELLELIQQRQRALVVVPTSAGKSFASFFVISEVMKTVGKTGNAAKSLKVRVCSPQSTAGTRGLIIILFILIRPGNASSSRRFRRTQCRARESNGGEYLSALQHNAIRCIHEGLSHQCRSLRLPHLHAGHLSCSSPQSSE